VERVWEAIEVERVYPDPRPGDHGAPRPFVFHARSEVRMIEPLRAPVRPRGMAPEIGEAILLEDVFLDALRTPTGAVEIVGGPGSGKTTALAHLASIVPPDRKVTFLDAPTSLSVTELADNAIVTFTSLRPLSVPAAVSYRLVPWGNDDVREYLLAAHAPQCRSVLARLQATPDRHLPGGLPELWRIVLDRMAADESLTSVAEALRQELHRALRTASQRTGAEQYCLAELTELSKQAAKCFLGLQRLHVDAGALRLLRHRAIRLILATERLSGFLESKSGDRALEERLPRELVKAVAAAASSAAIQNLSKWIVKRPAACHAMAASLLHAAKMEWFPNGQPLPCLSGAYLDAARWKAVNLAGARMERSDLSASDLTEAVLDEAFASRASFYRSVLHRASLTKIQANEADFSLAVLTSINARSAVFCDAVFTGADLTGAHLESADLHAAILADARLDRTDLSYANLTDAHIDGAERQVDARNACLWRDHGPDDGLVATYRRRHGLWHRHLHRRPDQQTPLDLSVYAVCVAGEHTTFLSMEKEPYKRRACERHSSRPGPLPARPLPNCLNLRSVVSIAAARPATRPSKTCRISPVPWSASRSVRARPSSAWPPVRSVGRGRAGMRPRPKRRRIAVQPRCSCRRTGLGQESFGSFCLGRFARNLAPSQCLDDFLIYRAWHPEPIPKRVVFRHASDNG
jgi:uncharacterized protein YjbI with pentapeptide repeats